MGLQRGLLSHLKPLLQALLYALAIFVASSAQAAYQAGLDAYQAGDYEKAMAEWKEEVNRPRVPTNLAVYREALYAIAMLYWKGEGVEQDYATSAVWLKQAADINHPGAQVKLGYLYSTGQGVPQNYQEARRWLQMAAAQGDPDAAHNLDILNREGLGLPDQTQIQTQTQTQVQTQVQPQPRPHSQNQTQSEPRTEPKTRTQTELQSETQPQTSGPGSAAPVSGTKTTASVESAEAGVTDTEEAGSDQVSEARPVDSTRDQTARAVAAEPAQDSDAAWILAQNPEYYTIQVIALRAPDNLHAFIAAHPDWAPFAIYHPAGNERPLSVLVQGVYPDLASARAAVASFPPDLQAREALWVRKFGMVQEMLR